MKRICLLIVMVIISATAIYASKSQNEFVSNSETFVEAPIYWQGWAQGPSQLYITVYRESNQCDSFYAIATKRREILSGRVENVDNVELVVKDSRKSGHYYVTYNGGDYYFQM